MIIKIGDYLLEQELNAPAAFNIKKVGIVESGKNTGEKRETVIAYGVRLDHAIDRIAHEKLLEDETIVSLRQFVDAYSKIFEDFSRLLKSEMKKHK